MNSTLFRYRLLLRLLAPFILTFSAWQASRTQQLRLFRQRLGVCLPTRHDRPLWLHAASVGELIAAQPLIAALRQNFPDIPVVVTTLTPTGAQLAQQRLPADVQHFYLPMDWPGASRRFLQAVQPRAALIMETELWPNLFINIRRHNIPLIIINGRLSSRTRNTSSWVSSLHALCLQNVSAILARSEDDADAYIQLGAPADKVFTIGNIKFSHTKNDTSQAIDIGRPYVVAASTHDDEELQVAKLWGEMGQQTRGRLLVIAPRHPHRRNDILQQLHGYDVAVRSRQQAITATTQIYLADTLGELEDFMAGAECVFMGGSLVPRGGHNILEPARLGKAIVFGPHMQNFREEVHLLLAANAAQQVPDIHALQTVLGQWLAHPHEAAAYGQRAAHFMAVQNRVLDHYLQAVADTCQLDSRAAG